MSAAENEVGKTYIAHVSVSEAKAFNPAMDDPDRPETWATLAARDYDEKLHNNHEFYCPCCIDKGDKVRMKKPSGGYYQDILFDVIDPKTREVMTDPETGEPKTENRRYYIPPRYTLYPLQRHTCDLGQRLYNLSTTIKENGGIALNSTAGAYIVNLNIPAGQTSVKTRPRISLIHTGGFEQAASKAIQNETRPLRRIHKSQNTHPSTRSTGISHVEALGDMLDNTEFDRGQREHIILRAGGQGLTLAQAYHGKMVDMYRDLFANERTMTREGEKNHNQLALFHFKPIGNRKFWDKQSDGSMTVPGLAEQVYDKEGRHFYVSARINFQTASAFRAFEEAYRKDKERSFLVFTENATVDLRDFEKKRGSVDSKQTDHANVFIDTIVYNTAQMIPWTPPSAQMTIDFPELDQQSNPPSRSDTLESLDI